MMNSKVIEKFGQRIRQLRKEKDWTQEDLGQKADLDWRYIGDLERGEKNPSLETIRKLAKSFKLTPSELLESVK